MITGAVIGRDAELDLVQAFLDEVGCGPTGLVLGGEPGIGKTILWQAGVERARGRFTYVLTCRGTEAWADAIETLIALGELEQARAYLEAYEEISRRFTGDWAAASAGRSRGLLSAAEGDPQAAFVAFDGALTRLADSPFPLERARTLSPIGQAATSGFAEEGGP